MTEPTAPDPIDTTVLPVDPPPVDDPTAPSVPETPVPTATTTPGGNVSVTFPQPVVTDFPPVSPAPVAANTDANTDPAAVWTDVVTDLKKEVPVLEDTAVKGFESGGVKGAEQAVATEISTKVLAASSVAAIAAPLLSVANSEISSHIHNMAVDTPLMALISTIVIGGLTFAAGYARRELARLQ